MDEKKKERKPYILLRTANTVTLGESVCTLVKEGYMPWYGPIVFGNGDVAQAMVIRPQREQEEF